MNPDSYFDDDPWSHLLQEVHGGAVGKVAAVSVQAICGPGEVDAMLQAWRDRLEMLLGAPQDADVLKNVLAASLLAKYQEGAIGRVFIDCGGGAAATNIEIAGPDGLLIWKPDVHPLSVILSPGGTEVSTEHAYAASLGEVMS